VVTQRSALVGSGRSARGFAGARQSPTSELGSESAQITAPWNFLSSRTGLGSAEVNFTHRLRHPGGDGVLVLSFQAIL